MYLCYNWLIWHLFSHFVPCKQVIQSFLWLHHPAKNIYPSSMTWWYLFNTQRCWNIAQSCFDEGGQAWAKTWVHDRHKSSWPCHHSPKGAPQASSNKLGPLKQMKAWGGRPPGGQESVSLSNLIQRQPRWTCPPRPHKPDHALSIMASLCMTSSVFICLPTKIEYDTVFLM